jgi:exodeoxyribonuclease-5
MAMWSLQQEEALRKVSRWLKNPENQQLFRLFGYAGTGKTTLARHLAEGVDGDVLFAAFTGKAASVLRASGAPNAQTLHSLIYHSKERSRARLQELYLELEEVDLALADGHLPPSRLSEWQARRERLLTEIRGEEKNAKRPDFTLNLDSPLRKASLLVVDECSMVDEEMARDILSFGCPVLVLGDPAQLPPIRGTGYFTDAQPDVMLTEIHRQARDNPIIYLATQVRSGADLRHGEYGSSRVIQKASPELAMEASQILVGLNRTRMSTNRRMRELKGFSGSPWPKAGEKLVCLRNDRDLGLLNGTLHETVADTEDVGGYLNLRIRPEDGGEAILVSAHREHFDGDPEQIGFWDRRNAQEFTFGYALTVHKSQGSQWSKVLIIDESTSFKQLEVRRRWLYTAITRAQDSVTVVRG